VKKPRRTAKQIEIMGIILREVSAGRFINQTMLYDMVSYKAECSYGAIRVSVAFLEKQGMLIRTKTGNDTHLVPTDKGYDWFRPLR
jgi:predicted transcriptional regulator